MLILPTQIIINRRQIYKSNKNTKPWKYVVFQNGNKDLKEFQWKVGTDSEVSKCANDAVAYAISLKEKMK